MLVDPQIDPQAYAIEEQQLTHFGQRVAQATPQLEKGHFDDCGIGGRQINARPVRL